MVQFVCLNYPGIVNMVQLSQTFFHETVIVYSIDLPKSEPILVKYTGWLFVIELYQLKVLVRASPHFHHYLGPC